MSTLSCLKFLPLICTVVSSAKCRKVSLSDACCMSLTYNKKDRESLLHLREGSAMAFLNYTAQDFASSLENRRPGVLPNPCYAKHGFGFKCMDSNPCTRSTIFYLFSAMQNFYPCILYDNHYNYYQMF